MAGSDNQGLHNVSASNGSATGPPSLIDSCKGLQCDHKSTPSRSIDTDVKKVLKVPEAEFLKATNEFTLRVDPKGRTKRDHIVADAAWL
ncbi:hypothetical protein [Luteibacter jiangsuensis]